MSKPLPKTIKLREKRKERFIVARLDKNNGRHFLQVSKESRFVEIEYATRFETPVKALERFLELHEARAFWATDLPPDKDPKEAGIVICELKEIFLDVIPIEDIELELAERSFEYYCEDMPEWRAKSIQLALDQTGKKFYPQEEKETEDD